MPIKPAVPTNSARPEQTNELALRASLVTIAKMPVEVSLDPRVEQLIAAADRAVLVTPEEKAANPKKGQEGHRQFLGTLQEAIDLDSALSGQVALIEEKRKTLAGPLNAALTAWNDIWNLPRNRIDSSFTKARGAAPGARQVLGKKMTDFKMAELTKARELAAAEEKRQQDAAAAEAARLESEAQEKQRLATELKTQADALAEDGNTAEAEQLQEQATEIEADAIGTLGAAEQVLNDAADAPLALAPVGSGTVRGNMGGTASFKLEWQLKAVHDAALVPREYCTPDEKLIKEAIEAGVKEIPGCTIEEGFAKKTRG
jgi:hypothetical protein